MLTTVDIQDIPVSFDYCGKEGNYMVILLHAISGQYLADVGFIEACGSDNCTGGYHITGVCGQKPFRPRYTHYDTKEQAAQALYELWTK